MIKVELKGGDIREFEKNITPLDIAKSISMGLYKSLCACKIDEKVCDIRTPLLSDCKLELLTFDDEDGKKAFDFDVENPFDADDIEKIEAEMKKIVKSGISLEKFELEPNKALELLEEMNEPYKIELVKEHAENGEPISFYKQDEFTDLCAGPHLASVSAVKAFKLTNCTGAYWRGDSKNAQLCRVYGISFPE